MLISAKKSTGRKRIRRGAGIQSIAPQDLRIKEELRYIQQCAAKFDARVVGLGQIFSFSTQTGDAWLLDPADNLAACVARDGSPEDVYIEETDTSYAIRWKGNYQIDGAAFIYTDWETGRIVITLDYPVEQIAAWIEQFQFVR